MDSPNFYWLHKAQPILVCKVAANLAKATRDDPPSLVALTALSFIANIRSLIAFTSSESINSVSRIFKSSAFTNPSLDSATDKATLISSTKNVLVIFCSAKRGQANIGTPALTASSVEFHPQ
ncbi:hypothetical protein CFOL_v3_07293 [Cephalotus follicularis]|uniref:Uncharacterized protein n=1 Tax=Cephalotus follicularis TaxID=3775 RepID=A0A1Q3B7A6_CEPFO|nr:hypothetical protein CFOL_v3_07293 [Cephalotus follicularis]